MNLNEVKEFLSNDWARFSASLASALKSEIALLNSTNNSILNNTGKCIRPVVSIVAAKICSGGIATDDTIRFAAAAELLHNATLLHDDVADKSNERRGKPTVMSILGNSASVLIGDFWLVKAMERILESPQYGSEVIKVFSKTLSDLAEGEILQLQKSFNCDTTEDDYFKIIYYKTASLFEASAIAGAISVGAKGKKCEAVKQYAYNLGIAFQIKDDILDYSGTAELGKPVGLDLKEQKITLPLLGAFAKAGESLSKEMRNKIKLIGTENQYVQELINFVCEYSGIEYAEKIQNLYAERAIESLQEFSDCKEKEYLKSLALFAANRKS